MDLLHLRWLLMLPLSPPFSPLPSSLSSPFSLLLSFFSLSRFCMLSCSYFLPLHLGDTLAPPLLLQLLLTLVALLCSLRHISGAILSLSFSLIFLFSPSTSSLYPPTSSCPSTFFVCCDSEPGCVSTSEKELANLHGSKVL